MGKNSVTYRKRSSVNEFERKPLNKYQLLIQRTVLSKPKAILSKEMMDAKLEKKKKEKEKYAEKRLLLENKLAQNIKETNNLKNLNKKRKMIL